MDDSGLTWVERLAFFLASMVAIIEFLTAKDYL